MGWRRNFTKYYDDRKEHPDVAQINVTTPPTTSTPLSLDDSLTQKLKSGLVISTSDVVDESVPDVRPLSNLIFTPEQVALRDGQLDANGTTKSTWIVVGDRVYDVTEFMVLSHPGGRDVIEAFAGKQCDWQFEYFHHTRHLAQWHDQLFVGFVSPRPPNPFPKPPKEKKADWRIE